MTQMQRFLVLALTLILLAGPGSVIAKSITPFPGTYVVAVKERLENGADFARLATYSFQPDGTMRQDYWYWSSASRLRGGFTPAVPVGVANQPGYSSRADSRRSVLGPSEFIQQPPRQLFGRWSQDGSTVSISWSNGDTELWQITWSDETLFKIEPVEISRLSGDFQLTQSGARNPTAVNGGWGFGGSGTGGDASAQFSQKTLTGAFLRRNEWNCKDEPVQADMMDLAGYFRETDTGVLRYVSWDEKPGARHHVFHYLVSLKGSSLGRAVYQVSHDFDNDGHIEKEIGHVYAGLQVIDATGRLRGLVMSDASPARNKCTDAQRTIGAMYYLDTPTGP